ncbi:sweet protein mabinlin-1, chain B [Ricinus communis]|uniref:2S seed storage albumin protein n=2 Tax=Ricinus communis TaxID=3988 RepID=2SS_RICCO|nr:RecName: Full=2S seed storage albumin protein; AltName: Full=2S albumin; AltName: Allergen=Ric c 1/3; Contains: RecName: Full=Allergen Ric c 3 small chain; AltName: Full=4.7 kDa napin-like protein small chain; AltName: Full=CB-1A small chain; AltName: Full=RS1A; Contains: RecName: Full=Allergen Ric c 3 large chain; AltName: Full=CB-1A large chain; AltName: Full=RL1; Contains: RecName: Full=Allergen Ric c 1 small chain; AltName: Full=2S albumin small chain; AltName: Full=4 kDa napin-like protein |eukprot:XP_002522854.1 2S albumin [Ricinus communis]
MAKLIPTIALVSVLLFIIANASFAYRTTITTIEIDESKGEREGSSSQQCRQEVQRKDLSSCERYLRQSSSRRSPGEEVLRMPGDENQQQESQQLQQCCNQVKQVRDECQCEAIKYIAEDQIQQGQLHGEESERVAQRAGEIVSSCGVRCMRQTRTNPSQQGCRGQIQEQQNLRQCQEYIKQQVSGQGPRRSDNQERSLRGCCDHLKQMQSQCRCEGLRQAIEQQQSQGQLQGQDVFEAFRTAANLPSMCGVSPTECRF